ncbi:MAG: hypothetical protein JNL68_10465 [Burkholderiales bacterium]|nr:hypothetical protein [Burkholderiales bacterium]
MLDILWSANFMCPLAYAGLALLLGVVDEAAARRLWIAAYLCGAIAASGAVGAHALWCHWSPADLPVHRARARAADLPILRVRLVQVWALDSLAGMFGFALALLGFPRDIWIWFMLASAALLFLHHPAQLRLAETAG